MWKYYDQILSGKKLEKVYEILTPQVKHYLESEMECVLSRINPGDTVLDLGCGYGRIIPALLKKASYVIGIDNSFGNLNYGIEYLSGKLNYNLLCMNAAQLGLKPHSFDAVICIQNGISAFHVDQKTLIKESLMMCRKGGVVMFSTYSSKFWEHRLEWFRLQSDAGLLGEIDMEKTKDGVIVCKDGFTATTVSSEKFRELTKDLAAALEIIEIEESSLFCVLRPQ